jgi:hypothetical protein
MAKAKRPGEVPTIALQPTPQIHEHQPAKTIEAAVKGAQQHVANVENSAGKK